MIIFFGKQYMTETDSSTMDKVFADAIRQHGYIMAELRDRHDQVVATISNDNVSWNRQLEYDYPYFLSWRGEIIYAEVYAINAYNKLVPQRS